MGYVENNLLPNEEIVYKAKIHWIIYRISSFGSKLSYTYPIIYPCIKI
jgi:hypothetical protein